jgi:hypothetical protein
MMGIPGERGEESILPAENAGCPYFSRQNRIKFSHDFAPAFF